MNTYKKKLIEVALPLQAINAAAAREKSIRHGHPSTLHLWWSRKPLAACRAVLFASLVDDPSAHPERFPDEETQEAERQRLFGIIERMVIWENSGDEALFAEAHAEIRASCDGEPPPVLDPFAGGGSIPLEAQRLGLEAHAGDLNPVAVLINKALIEIPPRFAGMAPVNPEARRGLVGKVAQKGATGLAEDVRYYGEWLKQRAVERLGHLYPKAQLPDGSEATVIAWKWVRTVKCPNPACGAEMPLANSFELSKKKGKEAWIQLDVDSENHRIEYTVRQGKGDVPSGTVNRRGARCACCGQPVNFPYIRAEGQAGRMRARLVAIVAEGSSGRIYLSANERHIRAAEAERPEDAPNAPLPINPRDFKTPNYGLLNFSDLFTPRQLTTLVTFSDLVGEAIRQAEADALAAGMVDDSLGLDACGSGAKAYGEAMGVYLAMLVDKQADLGNALNRWEPVAQCPRQLFARQAIPMVWDFAEGNPLGESSGSWSILIDNMMRSFLSPAFNFSWRKEAFAAQSSAMHISQTPSIVISTDPPYYDNIGYADLSDFFYVWLRRSLAKVYPSLFATLLVPKAEELVATPYRFGNDRERAKTFFEQGMLQAFSKMREATHPDYPLTVYYAFKQSDTEADEDEEEATDSRASSGWETMLNALIRAGFAITGTWPLRTEMMSRAVAQNANALASSIALVCRPRPDEAPSIMRRAFLSELRPALAQGLHDLQSGDIAPVDLAQASIGPGMAVYSKYSEVLEADGRPMSVRAALGLINQELDALLAESEGELDTESRFCIAWFEQYGLGNGPYGEADVLARARLANLDELESDGALEKERGLVRLTKRSELPEKWHPPGENTVWTMAQHLCRSLDKEGIPATASLLRELGMTKAEKAKSLAYRAFIIAERKGLTEEALSYNSLVASWPELRAAANALRQPQDEQQQLHVT